MSKYIALILAFFAGGFTSDALRLLGVPGMPPDTSPAGPIIAVIGFVILSLVVMRVATRR